MTFLKSNAIAIICLILTIGSILINYGVNQHKTASLHTEIAEIRTLGTPFAQRNNIAVATLERDFEAFKAETKEKVREVEILTRSNNDKVNDKLDMLNRQMAVVISWVEEQKRTHGK